MLQNTTNTKEVSVRTLEKFGRVRLSKSFYMREFLHSEVAARFGLQNYPANPDLAIEAGRNLCQELLEPIQDALGRISIRSAYRSAAVNQPGNELSLSCARNEVNRAAHIWDQRDSEGRMGATACIVIPRFADFVEFGGDWRVLAWWIHDQLSYSSLVFFPRLAAINIQWREEPVRRIDSYVYPRGNLIKAGDPDQSASHADWYEGSGLFAR
jgi:hypothetical protein